MKQHSFRDRPKSLRIALAGFSLATMILAAPAQTIPLVPIWQSYNPNNLLSLSNQSSSGFTAFIATNTAGGTLVLPRIYQTFVDQPFTNYGARVAVTFDLVFNNATVVGDTQFRFGLGNTNANELVWVGYDIGAPNGTCIRERMDPSSSPGISSPGPYQVGNWNDAFISGANLTVPIGGPSFVSSSSFPNGAGLGVAASLATKHSFRYSVERIPGQLMQDTVWSNSAGTGWVGASGAYNESSLSTNTPATWQQINTFGFGCNNTGLFGANGGSYTVSNLKIYNGFMITGFKSDAASGDVILTWESSPYDSTFGASYQVLSTADLTPPVTWATNAIVTSSNDQGGYWTSYTNAATGDAAQYYQIQKLYP